MVKKAKIFAYIKKKYYLCKRKDKLNRHSLTLNSFSQAPKASEGNQILTTL